MDFNIMLRREQKRKLKKDILYKAYLKKEYLLSSEDRLILKSFFETNIRQIDVARNLNISKTKVNRTLKKLKAI
jgi:DNA-directed RNA polymerase specialized sigma subunit